MKELMPAEAIEQRIFVIRGHKVMLSPHLAVLYGVETRTLVQSVKRNLERFPADFVFQLNNDEADLLVSQNVIPHKKYYGGHLPYAFTEQGVAMLSSVLRSKRAIQVNIAIMRAFIKLREIMATHKHLERRIDDMEKKYDTQFRAVFDAIRRLLTPPEKKKERIGFYKE